MEPKQNSQTLQNQQSANCSIALAISFVLNASQETHLIG